MAETKTTTKEVKVKTTTSSITKKTTSSSKAKPSTKPQSEKAKISQVRTVTKKVENKVSFENETLPKNVFGASTIYSQAMFDTILSERAAKRFSTHKVK
ncbi:50S ribosomal L4 domain protein, partial [Chlamydia psittaci 01DC11]